MTRPYLLTPGPVNVPEHVRRAMSEPILHHRTSDYQAVIEACRSGLKALFGTKQEVIPLASTGSGAMEAAVLSTCSPGDTVISVRAGKFGERWSDIGRIHGLKVVDIDVEWGNAVDPDAVAQALREHPGAKAVLVQANETSTAVRHPVPELAELTADSDTLLIVDGITAVGVYPLGMEDLGIDVLVTGSQKALMLPPGLALIALSEKAWRANETAGLKTLYFDLKREAKKVAANSSGFTSPVTLLLGLRVVLDGFMAEGLDAVYARHDAAARATRAGAEALGVTSFSKAPSPSLTAIDFGGIEGGAGPIIKHLEARYDMRAAGGQEHLKGRIMRIAHMGAIDRFHVLRAIGGLEWTLHDLGLRQADGAGTAAVMTAYGESK